MTKLQKSRLANLLGLPELSLTYEETDDGRPVLALRKNWVTNTGGRRLMYPANARTDGLSSPMLTQWALSSTATWALRAGLNHDLKYSAEGGLKVFTSCKSSTDELTKAPIKRATADYQFLSELITDSSVAASLDERKTAWVRHFGRVCFSILVVLLIRAFGSSNWGSKSEGWEYANA